MKTDNGITAGVFVVIGCVGVVAGITVGSWATYGAAVGIAFGLVAGGLAFLLLGTAVAAAE